ncbi:bifunctional diguanylate cyclase/phosphodiesterase [Clostridium chromiireducens]|uniref:Bifunctional diguanylate cyclase/phosphodiesterase n=1 Tax=Clostridium chromiireducens TaxID=225345 RepID=A0A399IJF2_9CLOT|nr:bifunctional diguanylate cyclase/phosphodiesterase [Clostridium chromiireducens]RII33148.1 bifunctional diguanylate cyclase/phosphodiesterase [Clostridium chromiireducens]
MLKKLESYKRRNNELVERDLEFYLNNDYKISPYYEALRISIIYGIIGALWILLSDRLLGKFITNMDIYIEVATYKGWLYVLITTILIYLLVLKRVILVEKTLKTIARNFEALSANNEELIALEDELRKKFEELEKQNDALLISEQRYELAVEGADCCIWDWEVEKDKYYFCMNWKSYLGYENDEVENTLQGWIKLIHQEDKINVVSQINDYILSNSSSYESIYRMVCKNGEEKWVLSKAKAIRNSDGKIVRMAGSHTDITEQKLIQNQLNSLAYKDMLTELPNRLSFELKVNELINTDKNNDSNTKFALLYMDIDNFKHVNDTLGHTSGDLLLKYISNILKYQVKAPDFVARLGGDEFAIIFEDIKNRQEIIDKVQKLIKYLRRPWVIDKQEFFISHSIGIAIYPEDGDNLSTLLKNSDVAMYFVKKNMKDNYCFYLQEIQEENSKKIKIINDLRRAIENKEFNLFYQPIIDLNSEKIIGVEALIRWFHPIRGMIPPMEFIPLAEENGLIHDIESWILETALMQKKQWEDMGYADLKMSINISGKSVTREGFINEVKDLLSRVKIKNDNIQFEVTETALMNDLNTSIKVLREIKDMNIKIALDDFGTGYSSLTYIKKLPIDVVKLDKDFIKNISKIEEEEVIVDYVIKLTHQLNLKIVAEGIETKEHLEFLKLNGCDYGQGYFFSKPITKEEIEKLLNIG